MSLSMMYVRLQYWTVILIVIQLDLGTGERLHPKRLFPVVNTPKLERWQTVSIWKSMSNSSTEVNESVNIYKGRLAMVRAEQKLEKYGRPEKRFGLRIRTCPFPCTCRNDSSTNKLLVDCASLGLDSIPNSIPQEAVELNLYNNSIELLLNDSFRYLSSLESLDLSKNNIAYVAEGAFTGLINLKRLRLNNNALNVSKAQLPVNIFLPLSRLNELSLTSNQIGENDDYPDAAIGKVTTLTILRINGVSNETFGVGFGKLIHLNMLDLSGSPAFQFVTKDTFVVLKNVSVWILNLSHCDLRWIHPEAFCNLPNIHTMEMSYNEKLELSNVGASAFGLQNTTIRKLICRRIHSGAMFTSIIADDFKYFSHTRLQELYMDNNKIVQFEPTSIRMLPLSLRVFSISQNRMQTSPLHLLDLLRLKNLRFLNGSCQITSTFRVGIRPPTTTGEHGARPTTDNSLSMDKLSRRKTHSIPELSSDERMINKNIISTYNPYVSTELMIPKHLEAVYLRRSFHIDIQIPRITLVDAHIKFMDISDNRFTIWNGPIEGIQRLEHLDLSGNGCTFVSPTFFAYFRGLKNLLIGRNKLGPGLDVSTFSNLTNLEEVDMQQNNIKYIKPGLFSGLRSLRYLDLSHNYISSWEGSIASLTNLRELNLLHNTLHSPPQILLKDLDFLQEIGNASVALKGNPLYCRCETEYFVRWLTETHVTILYWNDSSCLLVNDSRQNFDDFPVVLDHLEKRCRSYAPLVTGLSVSAAILLFAILVTILRRYRWKIRWFLYYMLNRRLRTGYERLDGENVDPFAYNAFISYEDSDRGFIIESVKSKLERDAGLKLCIDKRDFIPGLYVTDNIMRAIENSRKTVVLLSKKFLKSKWCEYELNMARMEGIHKGRDILNVVKMEALSARDLTADLTELLHSQSYMERSDDPHGDDLFWRRLVTAITSH